MKLLPNVALSFVLLNTFRNPSPADLASPPLGLWTDGPGGSNESLTLVCQSSGSVALHVQGTAPVSGHWTWTANSKGGLLTLHSFSAGFHNRLHYSVTYVDSRTIVFSDPFYRTTLRRI